MAIPCLNVKEPPLHTVTFGAPEFGRWRALLNFPRAIGGRAVAPSHMAAIGSLSRGLFAAHTFLYHAFWLPASQTATPATAAVNVKNTSPVAQMGVATI